MVRVLKVWRWAVSGWFHGSRWNANALSHHKRINHCIILPSEAHCHLLVRPVWHPFHSLPSQAVPQFKLECIKNSFCNCNLFLFAKRVFLIVNLLLNIQKSKQQRSGVLCHWFARCYTRGLCSCLFKARPVSVCDVGNFDHIHPVQLMWLVCWQHHVS